MPKTARNQSVVIVTGMHRSGTSLTASLLQSAGMNIGDRLMGAATGNDKGHFEDLDFVELHQDILQSQGISIAGWTKENKLQVQEQYLAPAKALIENKNHYEVWGWKDPRTTLFLDFWRQLIPEAKFVFIYRSPWDVVDSLFRRGDIIFKHNPNFAVQLWHSYNQAILDFCDRVGSAEPHRASEQCILFAIEDVINEPQFIIDSINEKFDLNLRSPQDLYERSLFKSNPQNSYRANLIKSYFPQAFELYERLHQAAKLAASEPNFLADNCLYSGNCESWILQDWLDLRWETKAKKRYQEELTQSQQELAQSQGELTQSQQELAQSQAKIAQLEKKLTQSQAKITQLQHQSAKEELTKLQQQFTQSQEELTKLQQQLQIATMQQNQLRLLIVAMESSKFWQIRKWWFDLKQKLNLSVTDALYQNYRHSTGAVVEPVTISSSKVIPADVPLSDNKKYQRWLERNYPRTADLKKMKAAASKLQYQPTISVIMPVYNPPARFLKEAIESVLAQVYPHWELCIADDCSTEANIRPILEEYAAKDSRIQVIFRQQNGHICRTSNSALELATGEYIALLDHDDLLAPHALYAVVELLNQHPEADFIYSDEDKINAQNIHQDPFFKPDWCPDSFLSRMYTCHLGVYRRSLVEEIGNFRVGFEGSQDYDLVLRLTEKTNKIFHLPQVLYHWRIHNLSTAGDSDAKPYATIAAQKAIAEAIMRRGEPGKVITEANFPGVYTVRYQIQEPKLVSIIIPTRDLASTLDVCLKSIFSRTTYPNYEVIVIDNGSVESETARCLTRWQEIEPERFKSYGYDVPFNYSQINNYGAEKATGDYLLFLNNDTEVITPDWIEAMVEQAQRPSIGAVGALLLYPDDTIQHAGVVLGIGGVAGHSHKNLPANQPGYISQAVSTNNYSAITGACLMCRREVFQEINGFNEELAVAFNDIDLCLKIIERGYRNIYLPHVILYHYESKSRGQENTPTKQARFAKEVNYMRQKWSSICDRDPCYSIHLTKTHEDYSIAT